MRDAVLVRPLVAAAGADPDAERGRLQMRHRVGHDRQAGGKTCDFDAHAAAPSRAARLAEEDITFDRRLIGRQHRDALGPLDGGRRAIPAAAAARRRPPPPHRETWPACAVPSTTIGTAGSRGFLLGDRDADGGVRIDEMAGLAQHGAHGRRGLLLVGAVGGEHRADLRERGADMREAPRLGERAHQRAHRRRVAAIGLEQQPLEIRRRPGCPSTARRSATTSRSS